MCLLIWTVFSGERCGPWASCWSTSILMHLMLDINVDRIVPSCLQLSHPGSSFDISFVRLFRTLDNIRYIWYLSSLPHSFAKVANCHHQGDKEIIYYQFLLSLTLFWQYWPMKGFLFWTIYSKTFVIQLLYLTTNLRRWCC